MRIDFGLVLALILEYIMFIYYADTLFYRKLNRYLCYAIIAGAYAFHLAICVFGNVTLNVIVALLVNFLCFKICYYIDYKNAAFQSAILLVLSMASEWFVVFMPYLGIPLDPLQSTPASSLILTLISKNIYLIGIMAVSHWFNSVKYSKYTPAFALITVPIISTVIIILMLRINANSNILSAICLLIIVINVIIFAINQWMIRKDIENEQLRRQVAKENVAYEEYMLLKEKYDQTRMFRHDLKEHINTLNSLIGENNDAAKAYIKSISREELSSRFTEYSDNKILNILLSKKTAECIEQGISLVIEPIRARLEFISDMDTVTIFSNLINNAIESCRMCREKKIFLDISTVNEAFVVIKVENTAETKPVVINGIIKTNKGNENIHGIGMNSIRRALKNYNGSLNWSYNADDKTFATVIMIKAVDRLRQKTTV